MTTAVAAPFRFFALHVIRTTRLGPSQVRVAFGGDDLDAFASGGRDQSLSLFLPHPGQSAPVVPVEEGDRWWQSWRALPPSVRAVMRSYTVRRQRVGADGTTEIDIDFALHGHGHGHGHSNEQGNEQGNGLGPGAAPAAAAPASRWASCAGPGDRVLALGPAVADNSGVRFRPPADTDLVVLWADESALPAAAAILESLPPGLRVHVWCTVPHSADRQDLHTAADARITWLVRDEHAPSAAEAFRTAALPPTTAPYAWLAGESAQVTAVRRHLVTERGWDRRRVTFVGYWRRGLSEEQVRAAAARE